MWELIWAGFTDQCLCPSSTHRDDGKESVKLYTNPQYFMELWCLEMAQKQQQLKTSRQRKVGVVTPGERRKVGVVTPGERRKVGVVTPGEQAEKCGWVILVEVNIAHCLYHNLKVKIWLVR